MILLLLLLVLPWEGIIKFLDKDSQLKNDFLENIYRSEGAFLLRLPLPVGYTEWVLSKQFVLGLDWTRLPMDMVARRLVRENGS